VPTNRVLKENNQGIYLQPRREAQPLQDKTRRKKMYNPIYGEINEKYNQNLYCISIVHAKCISARQGHGITILSKS